MTSVKFLIEVSLLNQTLGSWGLRKWSQSDKAIDFTEILLVSAIGTVWRTVWRIYIVMMGCEGRIMIISFLCIVLFGWTILIEITTRSARCTSKLKKKNIVEKDGFSSCHERGTKKKLWVPMRNRTSIVRIYHLLDLSSFLFFIQNTTLSTQLILAVCRTRVIYELFDGPCSPSSLCGSVVEHRSAVSDSLCYVFFLIL